MAPERNSIGLYSSIWAEAGDRSELPDFEAGYDVSYQVDASPDRRNMNDVLAKATAVGSDINKYGGSLPYAATLTYDEDAVVTLGGQQYRSIQTANTGNNPATATAWWSPIQTDVVPEASETVKGIAEIATNAEVSAGVDDSRIVSPKKLGAWLHPLLQALYPIGSIYTNASVATNPASLIGFGTWVRFGGGKVLVSQSGTDAEFDTLGETGGAKTHQLSVGEMPSHTHPFNAADNEFGNTYATTSDTLIGTRDTNAAGGDQAHNNLQPYIVVYMWKRTA